MVNDLEKRTEIYVVALPDVDIENVPDYSWIDKIGVTLASSEAAAIGNCLFRQLPREEGRKVMAEIREMLGGYERFAMSMTFSPENLIPRDPFYGKVVNVGTFLQGVYGGNGSGYADQAKKIVREVERKERQQGIESSIQTAELSDQPDKPKVQSRLF